VLAQAADKKKAVFKIHNAYLEAKKVIFYKGGETPGDAM
jgi:hypothetical protein